jgi:hypothetical protein
MERAFGKGVAVGTGVAMVEVTGGCVGARVSDAVCGGADCELVHPAQKIREIAIKSIPKM